MIITDHLIITRMPRTGSTWCRDCAMAVIPGARRAERDPHLQAWEHTHWAAVRRMFPKHASYVQVRSPSDWLLSLYHFAKERGGRQTIKSMGRGCLQGLAQLYDDDFYTMCMKSIESPHYINEAYWKYTNKVEYVGATEQCQDDLKAAMFCAGLHPVLKHWISEKVGETQHPTAQWNLDLLRSFQLEHALAYHIWDSACREEVVPGGQSL